jgi:hypothetical protein
MSSSSLLQIADYGEHPQENLSGMFIREYARRAQKRSPRTGTM